MRYFTLSIIANRSDGKQKEEREEPQNDAAIKTDMKRPLT
jgi:hypothetical protein